MAFKETNKLLRARDSTNRPVSYRFSGKIFTRAIQFEFQNSTKDSVTVPAYRSRNEFVAISSVILKLIELTADGKANYDLHEALVKS
jgi:hypothetical protein